MRQALIFVSAVLLLSAAGASAQLGSETRGSVYLGDFTLSSNGHGLRLEEGGGGVSVMHFFNPSFSTEFSVGIERQHYAQPVLYYPPTTQPPYLYFRRSTFTSYPVDAVAQYHFLNSTRWIPYLGVGAHYANGPHTFDIDPQIAGGVLFRITPSFALRFDARQLLGNHSEDWNPAFKPFIGVSWRFGRRISPAQPATTK